MTVAMADVMARARAMARAMSAASKRAVMRAITVLGATMRVLVEGGGGTCRTDG